MKRPGLTMMVVCFVAVAILVCAAAFAQYGGVASPSQSGNPEMMGDSNMMAGGQNMMGSPGTMGGMPMMAMPMCATGGFQDPKTAAKMLEMHAEMMRSNAAIMEKYAKQLEAGK